MSDYINFLNFKPQPRPANPYGLPTTGQQPQKPAYDPTTDPMVYDNWVKNDKYFRDMGLTSLADIDATDKWTPQQKLQVKAYFAQRYEDEAIPVIAKGDRMTQLALTAQFRQLSGDPAGRSKLVDPKTGMSLMPDPLVAATDKVATSAQQQPVGEDPGMISDVLQTTGGALMKTVGAAAGAAADLGVGFPALVAETVGANSVADYLTNLRTDLSTNEFALGWDKKAKDLIWNDAADRAALEERQKFMANGYGLGDFGNDLFGNNPGGYKYLLAEGMPGVAGSMLAGGPVARGVTTLASKGIAAYTGKTATTLTGLQQRAAVATGAAAAYGPMVGGGNFTDSQLNTALSYAAEAEGMSPEAFVRQYGESWHLKAAPYLEKLTEEQRATNRNYAWAATGSTALLAGASSAIGGIDARIAGGADPLRKINLTNTAGTSTMEMGDEYLSQEALRQAGVDTTGRIPVGMDEIGGNVAMAGLGDASMSLGGVIYDKATGKDGTTATPTPGTTVPPAAGTTPPQDAGTPPPAPPTGTPAWMQEAANDVGLGDTTLDDEETGEAVPYADTVYASAQDAVQRMATGLSDKNSRGEDVTADAAKIRKKLYDHYDSAFRNDSEGKSPSEIAAAAAKAADNHLNDILAGAGRSDLGTPDGRTNAKASAKSDNSVWQGIASVGVTAKGDYASTQAASQTPRSDADQNMHVLRRVADYMAQNVAGQQPLAEDADFDTALKHVTQGVAQQAVNAHKGASLPVVLNAVVAHLNNMLAIEGAGGDTMTKARDWERTLTSTAINSLIDISNAAPGATDGVLVAIRPVAQSMLDFNGKLTDLRAAATNEAQAAATKAGTEATPEAIEEIYSAKYKAAAAELTNTIYKSLVNEYAKDGVHIISKDIEDQMRQAAEFFVESASLQAGRGSVMDAINTEAKANADRESRNAAMIESLRNPQFSKTKSKAETAAEVSLAETVDAGTTEAHKSEGKARTALTKAHKALQTHRKKIIKWATDTADSMSPDERNTELTLLLGELTTLNQSVVEALAAHKAAVTAIRTEEKRAAEAHKEKLKQDELVAASKRTAPTMLTKLKNAAAAIVGIMRGKADPLTPNKSPTPSLETILSNADTLASASTENPTLTTDNIIQNLKNSKSAKDHEVAATIETALEDARNKHNHAKAMYAKKAEEAKKAMEVVDDSKILAEMFEGSDLNAMAEGRFPDSILSDKDAAAKLAGVLGQIGTQSVHAKEAVQQAKLLAMAVKATARTLNSIHSSTAAKHPTLRGTPKTAEELKAEDDAAAAQKANELRVANEAAAARKAKADAEAAKKAEVTATKAVLTTAKSAAATDAKAKAKLAEKALENVATTEAKARSAETALAEAKAAVITTAETLAKTTKAYEDAAKAYNDEKNPGIKSSLIEIRNAAKREASKAATAKNRADAALPVAEQAAAAARGAATKAVLEANNAVQLSNEAAAAAAAAAAALQSHLDAQKPNNGPKASVAPKKHPFGLTVAKVRAALQAKLGVFADQIELIDEEHPQGQEANFDPETKKMTMWVGSLESTSRAVHSAWHEVHHKGQDAYPLLTEEIQRRSKAPIMQKMIPIIIAEWGAAGITLTTEDAVLEAAAELSAALRTKSDEHIKERYGVEVNQKGVRAWLADFLDALRSLLGAPTNRDLLRAIRRLDAAADVGAKTRFAVADSLSAYNTYNTYNAQADANTLRAQMFRSNMEKPLKPDTTDGPRRGAYAYTAIELAGWAHREIRAAYYARVAKHTRVSGDRFDPTTNTFTLNGAYRKLRGENRTAMDNFNEYATGEYQRAAAQIDLVFANNRSMRSSKLASLQYRTSLAIHQAYAGLLNAQSAVNPATASTERGNALYFAAAHLNRTVSVRERADHLGPHLFMGIPKTGWINQYNTLIDTISKLVASPSFRMYDGTLTPILSTNRTESSAPGFSGVAYPGLGSLGLSDTVYAPMARPDRTGRMPYDFNDSLFAEEVLAHEGGHQASMMHPTLSYIIHDMIQNSEDPLVRTLMDIVLARWKPSYNLQNPSHLKYVEELLAETHAVLTTGNTGRTIYTTLASDDPNADLEWKRIPVAVVAWLGNMFGMKGLTIDNSSGIPRLMGGDLNSIYTAVRFLLDTHYAMMTGNTPPTEPDWLTKIKNGLITPATKGTKQWQYRAQGKPSKDMAQQATVNMHPTDDVIYELSGLFETGAYIPHATSPKSVQDAYINNRVVYEQLVALRDWQSAQTTGSGVRTVADLRIPDFARADVMMLLERAEEEGRAAAVFAITKNTNPPMTAKPMDIVDGTPDIGIPTPFMPANRSLSPATDVPYRRDGLDDLAAEADKGSRLRKWVKDAAAASTGTVAEVNAKAATDAERAERSNAVIQGKQKAQKKRNAAAMLELLRILYPETSNRKFDELSGKNTINPSDARLKEAAAKAREAFGMREAEFMALKAKFDALRDGWSKQALEVANESIAKHRERVAAELAAAEAEDAAAKAELESVRLAGIRATAPETRKAMESLMDDLNISVIAMMRGEDEAVIRWELGVLKKGLKATFLAQTKPISDKAATDVLFNIFDSVYADTIHAGMYEAVQMLASKDAGADSVEANRAAVIAHLAGVLKAQHELAEQRKAALEHAQSVDATRQTAAEAFRTALEALDAPPREPDGTPDTDGNDPLRGTPGKKPQASVAPKRKGTQTPTTAMQHRAETFWQRFVNNDEGVRQWMADVYRVTAGKFSAKYDLLSALRTLPHLMHTRRERDKAKFVTPLYETMHAFQVKYRLSAEQMEAVSEAYRKLEFYYRVMDRANKFAAVHGKLEGDNKAHTAEIKMERESLLDTMRNPKVSPTARRAALKSIQQLWLEYGSQKDAAKWFGISPARAAVERKRLLEQFPLADTLRNELQPLLEAASLRVLENNKEGGVLGRADTSMRNAYGFKTYGSTHWDKDNMENILMSDHMSLDQSVAQVEETDIREGTRGVTHFVHPVRAAEVDIIGASRRAEIAKVTTILANLTRDYGKELGLEFALRDEVKPLYDIKDGTIHFMAGRVLDGEVPIFENGNRMVIRSVQDVNGRRNMAVMNAVIRRLQPGKKPSAMIKALAGFKNVTTIGWTALNVPRYTLTALGRDLLTPMFSYTMRTGSPLARSKGVKMSAKALFDVATLTWIPAIKYAASTSAQREAMAAQDGFMGRTARRIKRLADAGGYAEMSQDTFVHGLPMWMHDLIGNSAEKKLLMRPMTEWRGTKTHAWDTVKRVTFGNLMRWAYAMSHYGGTMAALSVFEEAIASGVDETKAAAEALSLYDPMLVGSDHMELAYATIPFLRAYQSDIDRSRLEVFADELGIPARKLKDPKVWGKLSVMLAMFGTAGYLAAALGHVALGGDDDDDIPTAAKLDSASSLWRVYLGGDAEHAYFVDMPFGVSTFMMAMGNATYRADQGWDDLSEATSKVVIAGMRNFSPIQLRDTTDMTGQGVTRTLLTLHPAAGILYGFAANENAFGRNITPEGIPKNGLAHISGFTNTPQAYKDAAAWMYSVGLDVYPESLKYIVDSTPYVGPILRSATSLTTKPWWPHDTSAKYYWDGEARKSVTKAMAIRNRPDSGTLAATPELKAWSVKVLGLHYQRETLKRIADDPRYSAADRALMDIRMDDLTRQMGMFGHVKGVSDD